MAVRLINITLGTAGHIDHGKTALVKNLTGCDTDYLKEEKERGMSIELGFAPCLISDMEVGIVDVPGHENFIKTMVAGAAGMDGVIFVVAADDGVMPQTMEHLEILSLLGVRGGIVALTKADRASADQLELVSSQIKDLLAGTFLENAAIVPLSNISGAGFDVFSEELHKLIDSIKPKRTDGLFRMPVERSFSVKGYGTVVTGIPVSGSAKIGDELILLPQNQKGRIKSIQVYKHTSDTVLAGQCAALNIPQLDHKTIERGNVIVAGESFSPQSWYLCRLKLLAGAKPLVKNGQEVKFHTGTSEVMAAVYLMQDEQLSAGRESVVQIRLAQPLVAGPTDRFIIRSLSPVRTIGGGIIVDALPARLKRSSSQVQADIAAWSSAVLDEKDFVEYHLRKAPQHIASASELSGWTKLPQDRARAIARELVAQHSAIELADGWVHGDVVSQLQQRLLDLLAEHHKAAPQSPGLDAESLCRAAELEKAVFDLIVARLKDSSRMVQRAGKFALPSHREAIPDGHRAAAERVEALFLATLFSPPDIDEVAVSLGMATAKIDATVRLLIEHQRLVMVEKGLYFHADAVAKAKQLLRDFIVKEGVLESVKFKYLLNTTRKYAIPLLDYFDRVGVTRRDGHSRYLK